MVQSPLRMENVCCGWYISLEIDIQFLFLAFIPFVLPSSFNRRRNLLTPSLPLSSQHARRPRPHHPRRPRHRGPLPRHLPHPPQRQHGLLPERARPEPVRRPRHRVSNKTCHVAHLVVRSATTRRARTGSGRRRATRTSSTFATLETRTICVLPLRSVSSRAVVASFVLWPALVSTIPAGRQHCEEGRPHDLYSREHC